MEALLTVAAICAAVASVVGVIAYLPRLASWLRTTFRNSPWGRKQQAHDTLERLATDVQIEYFISLLGPVVFKNVRKDWDEYVFVSQFCYVLAVANKDARVLTYVVTSRTRDFKPRIRPRSVHPKSNPILPDLRIGEFSFNDLEAISPSGIRGFLGANRFGYLESYYFGNPGNYQHYLVGVNDAGFMTPSFPISDAMPDYGVSLGALDTASAKTKGASSLEEFLARPETRTFRKAAIPNTYGVSSNLVDGPDMPGVNHGQVRLLPK